MLVSCFTPCLFNKSKVPTFDTGSIPFPIIGAISTIEHSAFLGAKNSATSRPTAPPPIITTFLPFKSSG